jgi:hypothetical protein
MAKKPHHLGMVGSTLSASENVELFLSGPRFHRPLREQLHITELFTFVGKFYA